VGGLAAGVGPVPGAFGEAVGAEAFGVVGGFFLEKGFGQEAADACGTADAMGVAAAGHDKAFHARAFSNDKAAIRCEGGPTAPNPGFFATAGFLEECSELLFERVEHGTALGSRMRDPLLKKRLVHRRYAGW